MADHLPLEMIGHRRLSWNSCSLFQQRMVAAEAQSAPNSNNLPPLLDGGSQHRKPSSSCSMPRGW